MFWAAWDFNSIGLICPTGGLTPSADRSCIAVVSGLQQANRPKNYLIIQPDFNGCLVVNAMIDVVLRWGIKSQPKVKSGRKSKKRTVTMYTALVERFSSCRKGSEYLHQTQATGERGVIQSERLEQH